jgi:hypothetical protein
MYDRGKVAGLFDSDGLERLEGVYETWGEVSQRPVYRALKSTTTKLKRMTMV